MSEAKCSEKMVFETKKEAEDTARVAAFQHGSKLKAYRCKDCELWHLATSYAKS